MEQHYQMAVNFPKGRNLKSPSGGRLQEEHQQCVFLLFLTAEPKQSGKLYVLKNVFVLKEQLKKKNAKDQDFPRIHHKCTTKSRKAQFFPTYLCDALISSNKDLKNMAHLFQTAMKL